MFNVLVADSSENELNHLIFLLEDYKANNPEFDHIVNIIDADSYDKALEIVESRQIDILFISTEMDKIAFKAYKKSNRTLIISIGDDYSRLRNWYIDHIRKPLLKTLFHLKFRSYLDILFFKKVGINSFVKVTTYDLSLISNLHIFWESHFTTRSNVNEVLHIIYSLGIYQIDMGRESIIEVIETENDISFVLKTEVKYDLIQHLEKIRRGIDFVIDEHKLTFQVFFDDSAFDELLGEYEDFALDYLNYDKLETLNSFLLEHDLKDSEDSIKMLEKELGTDKVTTETLKKYLGRKTHKASIHFSFMDESDLKSFGKILERFEQILVDNDGVSFSIEEFEEMIDLLTDLSRMLVIYPSTRDTALKLRELCSTILSDGRIIRENDEHFVKSVGKVVEDLDDWHRALSKRRSDVLDEDLRDHSLIDSIDIIIDKYKN
jgi:hypothetical protein